MRVITLEVLVGWTTGAGLVALGALGWALWGPGGLFWNAALALALGATALATAALLRGRASPTLAQVIEIAEHDEIGPRPRGEARR